MKPKNLLLATTAVALLGSAAASSAQTAYGVSGTGSLFSFDISSPTTTTTIGNLGFIPEAIDFRPGLNTLYAIDVGAVNSQLFTVSLVTGTATPVGTGFASVGTGYTLDPSQGIGFDFNPKTLQADGSIRIRVTSTSGADLRLNSDTGGIAAIDGALDYPATDPNDAAVPAVMASAYLNNVAQVGGTTTLFDIDAARNALVTQNPPNSGTLNTLPGGGLLGIDVDQIGGFDIFTDAGGANTGFAILRTAGDTQDRLYSIDLTTGAASLLGNLGAESAGGFAVAPIPEPGTVALLAIGGAMLAGYGWRKRKQQ